MENPKNKANPDCIPQPAVASISRAYQVEGHGQSKGGIADQVKIILREMAAVVRQSGGFIGHIKAFISFTEGGSISMSVVKDKVDHQQFDFPADQPASGFKVAITAIVYGFNGEELSRLLNFGLAVGLPESICRVVEVKTNNLKPIAPFVS